MASPRHLACMVLLLSACNERAVTADSLDDETSTDNETTGDGDGDGDFEATCGNGIVEPGEDCEPDGACDECSDDCRFDPLPTNEWAIARDMWFDQDDESIEIGPSGIVHSRGLTSELAPRLLTVTPDGVVMHDFGPAEHDFVGIEDIAVGPADDLALLGSTTDGPHVRHMLADGTFEAPIPVSADGSPAFVALTEHGISRLVGGYVHTHAFDGTLSWVSDEPWSSLDNVDGRLVVTDPANDLVEFVAGDGTDPRRWEDSLGLTFNGEIRVASSAPVLIGAIGAGGAVYVGVLSLWTGEGVEDVIASGLDGLETPAWSNPLDATSDGWPIVRWSVCETAGVIGCSVESSGVGGPDDPNVVDVHDCDLTRSLRVGPDGGVYLLTWSPDEQTWQLARRMTLG
jgi:hypothetical protein